MARYPVNQPSQSADELIFVHRFNRELVATLRVTKPAESDGPVIMRPNCEWSGRFKPKHVPEYRQWGLSVHERLSELWQMRIMYALIAKLNETELWLCEPGKAPRLVQKLGFGIP